MAVLRIVTMLPYATSAASKQIALFVISNTLISINEFLLIIEKRIYLTL